MFWADGETLSTTQVLWLITPIKDVRDLNVQVYHNRRQQLAEKYSCTELELWYRCGYNWSNLGYSSDNWSRDSAIQVEYPHVNNFGVGCFRGLREPMELDSVEFLIWNEELSLNRIISDWFKLFSPGLPDFLLKWDCPIERQITQILCNRILRVAVTRENQPSTSNVRTTSERTWHLVGWSESLSFGVAIWRESCCVFQWIPRALWHSAGVESSPLPLTLMEKSPEEQKNLSPFPQGHPSLSQELVDIIS